MALTWSDEYENEEELKKLSGLDIRSLYLKAPSNQKAKIAKVAAEKLVTLDDSETIYDTLGRLKVVDDYNDNTENEQVDVDYDRLYKSFSEKVINYKSEEGLTALAECFDIKTLTTLLKVSASKLGDELRNSDNYKSIDAIDTAITQKIENGLKSSKEFSPDVIERFYMAEQAGALNNVAEDARNKFLSSIMQQTGWTEVSKEDIETADKKLNDNILSVDVYIEKDGKKVLNPLFDGCSELANSIAYEFPDGTDEATTKNLTNAYNQQLMANALQRATQDVLRNPDLLPKGVSREEIEAKFKNIIADNFSRSVIVAGLASSPNTTGGISINSKTGRAEYDNSDDLADDINEVMNGTKRISPLAVNLDTRQLGLETTHTERMLDIKQVDRSKISFFYKVKNVVKAAYNNVVKQGGWKKIAVNMAMFGGSAIAMASGASAVIAAGAAVYAGWTAANAWVAPVWDKLSAEMREKNITGFRNKLAYRLNNWKRAKEQKYAEPGFMGRATWRTVEGAVVGGITASLGLGGVGAWAKTLVRQGVMVVGKSASLAKSLFKRKTAAEKLAETYSVANYRALQAAEGYLKQDKIALGAVIGGALIGDAVKLHAEGSLNASVINEKISEISAKIKENLGENNEVGAEGNVSVESQDTATNGEEATATNGEEATATNGEEATADQAGGDINIGEQSEGYASVTIGDETVKIKLVDADRLEKLETNTANKFKYNGELQRLIDNQKEVLKHYKDAGNISNTANINDGTVENFYDAINNGKVTTIPQGMSAIEYVDRMVRLIQFSAHKKACGIMLKDMLCDKFIPSDGDKLLVAKALNDIEYVKADMQYVKLDLDGNVIYDNNGNPCIGTTSRWGQYVGNQKYETITRSDGTTIQLPRRYDTVITSIGVNNDCEPKVGTSYNVNEPGCGCDSDPEPKIDPDPVIKPEPRIDDEPPCDCTPPEEFANAEDIANTAENDAVAPKEEVSVNMQDPYAKGTAIKSGKGTYYDVELDSVNGKVKGFNGGADQVWDKDGATVAEEGYEDVVSQGRKGLQIEVHNATDVTQIVDKLPDVPTDVVIGDDGSITYVYEFKNGKNISVVIDAPKDGETDRVGHFLIGRDEIVIDKASSQALMDKMSENTNIKFTSLDGDEQKAAEGLELTEKIMRKKEQYYAGVAEDMANPVAPSEDAAFAKPIISTEKVVLTSEQKTQIMSENTEITCVDIKDGKAILEVKGVEGVTRIAVAEPTHVNYNLRVMPTTTAGEDGSYSVGITTVDNKQMLVTIANGKAKTTLDGNPVVLDTQSSEVTQNLVNLALRKENVEMKVDLHSDFTEKVVKAVEAKNNTAQHSPVISRAQPTR